MVKRNSSIFGNTKLAELHVHVGGAVDPAIMWSIAHSQGIRLPTKDFWEFVDLITISKERTSWDNYHKLFYWTELIQSSPQAIERSIYEIISGAYRSCNITCLEVSFNPMLRNRGGEQDLDHIIMAALRGMDRALLEYPVKAGLIFFLDRRFSYRKNKIIVEKAIKYQKRGVIGIDLAGPRNKNFSYKDCQDLYKTACDSGLGLSVHTGEEGDGEEMTKVIEYLSPNRIIHGVKAAYHQDLLKTLVEKKIVLAICPTSNLKTGIVKNIQEYKKIIKTFIQAKVKFCINTDGPEMLKTSLLKEMEFLLKNKIMTKEQLLEANRIAFESSFIRREENEF